MARPPLLINPALSSFNSPGGARYYFALAARLAVGSDPFLAATFRSHGHVDLASERVAREGHPHHPRDPGTEARNPTERPAHIMAPPGRAPVTARSMEIHACPVGAA